MPHLRSLLPAALLSLSLLPGSAAAFCGFFVSGADADLYNNASQVVLLRKGSRTAMTMSNNYKGPPQDFAMVVPVPVVLKKEQVRTLSPDVFRRVDQLSAPRLVEYWEQDPCYQPPPEEMDDRVETKKEGAAPVKQRSGRSLGVTIEAKFEVGEYQILILSAKESSGLETWLRQNRYKIPKGAAGALAPYVRDQMKFFVAKVDIKKVKRDDHGLVVLSPLRFSFDAHELRLPVRLGLLNAEGAQDLLIYILHPEKRFEAANYKNVFIPTNVEVADAVRKGFGGFYASLFDETLRRAGGKAVVTEYAWQTSSCDPCPTPPLTPGDLYTLGDESVGASAAGEEARRSSRGPFFGTPSTYVLTRLHTRYDRKTLSEDLIFREAPPVLGGRANWDGTLGDQGAMVQAQQGGVNNFQGRYIIRHYWEGKVACQNPRYGIWGGPPSGEGQALQAAQDLANAPRGQVNVKDVVLSPLPQLGLAGKQRPLRPGEKR
jgi:hypothetical protein